MSLRTRISILISAAMVVVLLAVVAVFVNLAGREIRQNLKVQQTALVSALAGELDRQLLTLQKVMGAAAETLPRDALGNPALLQAYLESRKGLRAVFNSILVLSPEGRVLAANPLLPGYVGAEAGGLEFVARIRETRRPGIYGPFTSPFNNEPLFVVASPVLDSRGRMVAIVGGGMYFRRDGFFASFTENRIGKGGYLVLLSPGRQVLAYPDARRVMTVVPEGANPGFEIALKQGEFSGESVNSRGVPTFSTYRTLKTTGWLLGSALPLEEAYAPIRVLHDQALIGGLVLVVLLPLLVGTLVHFLTAPLLRFRDHIHGFSRGQFSARYELSGRRDELGDLARSFDELMQSRDQAEESLERQLALYAALGETNQAIIGASEPLPLFQEVCRIAVEFGRFRMAWIGLIDEPELKLVPRAWSGASVGFLDGLEISLAEDSPLAQGPGGKACLSGRAYVCNDFFNDPGTAPWHERARLADFKSAAAVPFSRAGKVVGVFAVYAETLGFFDARMLELLDRMAQDLSFALDHMDQELSRQEAERALATVNSRLGGIIDGSRDLIAAWGPDFHLIAFNAAFKDEMWRTWGVAVEAGMSPSAWLADSPGDCKRLKAQWKRPLKGERFIHEEQTTEGRWFETSYYPIHDAAGVVIGASQIVRDVTSRRLALESLRLLNRAVAQSPASIVITDTDGNIRYVNQSFCRVSGYSREEALGNNPRILGSGQTPPEVFKDLWDTISSGKTWTGRLLNRRKDGETFWESVLIQGIADDEGHILNYLAVKEDISAVMAAEAEIRELNASLERRVKERTAELDQAMKDLESFAYSVSHDLRTPLRAISGFSQILMDSEREHLSQEGQGLLERVVHNTMHMAQLIDDILAYSRAGNTTLHWRDVDMTELAEDVAGELRPAYPGVDVVIADLPTVRGDATMLRQIFANLIGNALKFTQHQENGRVQVAGKREGAQTVFEVRDNGAGFDMQYANKLFGMFQRMHSERQFQGTGVGLAIVKRLVERHGGRIWAAAEPGKGAVFSFSLVAAEAPETLDA